MIGRESKEEMRLHNNEDRKKYKRMQSFPPSSDYIELRVILFKHSNKKKEEIK